MTNIAKHLKDIRNQHGLSIRQLAENVGMSPNTISTYERNDVVPTVTNAVKICDYFKVPIEYLLYGKLILTDFNDTELLTLFRTVDEGTEEERKLAKTFLKKLVKNIKDRDDMKSEIE